MQSTYAKPTNPELDNEKHKFWELWSLKTDKGRQVWEFDNSHISDLNGHTDQFFRAFSKGFEYNSKKIPHSSDAVLRHLKGIDRKKPIEKTYSSLEYPNSLSRKAANACFNNIHALSKLQEEDGNWAGDYGGPMFLLPSLIIVSYITKVPFAREKSLLMSRYMLNHQNEDGGWGMHIEGNSMMFTTCLQYCALRILGHSIDDNELSKARNWILEHGGAYGVPSWGKFFLAVLGVYDWNGCNSLLPEMWSLPRSLPIHPGNYWCHSRMVYLPMSYCYGKRVTVENDPLILSLRDELYNEDYYTIKWSKKRNVVAETDVFKKTSPLLKSFLKILNLYEKYPFKTFRRKSLDFILDYINAEDEQTKYIDIGPVNQIINSLCIWHAYGSDSEEFNKHVRRWDDYLWLAEDGMKMNGYNGSQLWDTAFTVQAICESDLDDLSSSVLNQAYNYIDQSQIKEEVSNRKKYFRHPSVGGWPFSTLDHGWPISDCTAEGLKATLKMHRKGVAGINPISDERLKNATDLVLSWQNKDGGWATYENYRSGSWLELLNPSEIFGEIMIDYSWVECTSACTTALIEFQKDFPEYRNKEIQNSIIKGLEFIRNRQREDGSWIGSWGVCFTYGTWFGVEALSAGKKYIDSSDHLAKACHFLKEKQLEDGGWSESFESCVQSEYVTEKESHAVNTSWALMALMKANCQSRAIIDKGISYLLNQQLSTGEWPQQSISGVFNKTCMISYSAYRNIFPLWALGTYVNEYSRKLRHQPIPAVN